MVKDNTTVRDKPTTREEIEELKRRVALLENELRELRTVSIPSTFTNVENTDKYITVTVKEAPRTLTK